jgi:uncharacterized membrane protein YhhN
VRSYGFVLIAAAVFVAIADWAAVARANRFAEYVLKPLTLVVLIAAAALLKPGEPALRWSLTLVALALSLAGDVFLMLPRDLFVGGLGAFLLAHVAYVFAFNRTAPPEPVTAIAALGVAWVAIPLFLRMRRGMLERGQREFQVPVALYVLAIGAMVVSAIATTGRPEWPTWNSAAAIAGAVLFMASDAMIGWNRFVGAFAGADVAIISTYHLGQALLVLGLLG